MTGRRVARLVTIGGGAAGVVAAWLQWTVSGSAERNSYESLRSAQRLDIEQLTPFRVVWFLVPVAVVAMVVLIAARIERPAGITGVLVGLVLVAFGGGVLLTPVAAGVGPWLSCLAGLATVGASIVLITQGGHEN